jgi:hypothetical protein
MGLCTLRPDGQGFAIPGRGAGQIPPGFREPAEVEVGLEVLRIELGRAATTGLGGAPNQKCTRSRISQR